jgi:hypothetical protein
METTFVACICEINEIKRDRAWKRTDRDGTRVTLVARICEILRISDEIPAILTGIFNGLPQSHNYI